MAIRTVDKGTDKWGLRRWASQWFQGKGGNTLLVVSAYRVGRWSGTPGISTAWHQQKVLLMQQGREDEPATVFLTDLSAWILTQKSHTKNLHIAIFLDANERWTSTSQIHTFAEELGLVNLNLAGNYKFPPSHPCLTNPDRNTTINYCLCTP